MKKIAPVSDRTEINFTVPEEKSTRSKPFFSSGTVKFISVRSLILLIQALLVLTLPLFGASSNLYLGPQIYYGHLHVKNGKSPLSQSLGLKKNANLTGVLYGASGGYEYCCPCTLYANLNVRYGTGKLTGGHLVHNRHVHEYEVNAVLGYPYILGCCDSFCTTPYIGFGYQFQSFSLSEIHQKYRYKTYRIPIGLKIDFHCLPWNIGLHVSLIPQVDSTVKISALKGARWELCKRLDWEIFIPIEYHRDSCCQLRFRLTPFFRYHGTGKSTAKTNSGTKLGLPPQYWIAAGSNLELIWTF